MGINVCVVILLLTALATVVYCANDRPVRRGCDHRCLMRTLTGGPGGKRKKSVDPNQDGYLWNQKETSPTYTADEMTEGQRSTCVFNEVAKKLSPKWQKQLLAVLKGALSENNGVEIDDEDIGETFGL